MKGESDLKRRRSGERARELGADFTRLLGPIASTIISFHHSLSSIINFYFPSSTRNMSVPVACALPSPVQPNKSETFCSCPLNCIPASLDPSLSINLSFCPSGLFHVPCLNIHYPICPHIHCNCGLPQSCGCTRTHKAETTFHLAFPQVP